MVNHVYHNYNTDPHVCVDDMRLVDDAFLLKFIPPSRNCADNNLYTEACTAVRTDDGRSDVVVIDLPLLRVAVEGSDNPVSLEKPCQASLPPDQQGRHSLGRHPEVQYVA